MPSYSLVLAFAALLLIPLPVFAAFGDETAGSWLWWFVSQFLGAVGVGLTGFLLDSALYYTVLNFAELYRENVGFAVENLWAFVRDIFNITFIFGLVYIGFRTILDASDNNTKKALGLLIAAALLVNFSLFFTKAVIDFSNFAAVQLASLIDIDPAIPAGLGAASNLQGGAEDISTIVSRTEGQNYFQVEIATAFMEITNLQTILSLEPGFELAEGVDIKISEHLGYIFGVAVFFVITIFVFLTGAIMLIVRFVALIIYMIISPVMFLSWVFPGLSDSFGRYWSSFFNHAFYAPAYIFMMVLSFRVLVDMRNIIVPPGQSEDAALNPLSKGLFEGNTEGQFMIFLYFVVAAAFMFASVKVAESMAERGSKLTLQTAQRIRSGVGRGVGLPFNYGYRETVGRYANARETAMEKRGVRKSDPRRLLARRVRDRKIGGWQNYGEVQGEAKEAKRARARHDSEVSLQTAIEEGANAGANDKKRAAMETAISRASSDDILAAVKKYTPESPEYRALLQNMNSQQFKKISDAKEEDLDAGKRNKAVEARRAVVEEKLRNNALEEAQKTAEKNSDASGNPQYTVALGNDWADPNASTAEREKGALRSGIRKATKKELREMGLDRLTENAQYLTDGQVDDIRKDDDFAPTEVRRITEQRSQKFKELSDNLASSDSQTQQEAEADLARVMAGLKAKDKAALPDDILKSNQALEYIDAAVFEQMESAQKSPEMIGEIRKKLTDRYENMPKPPDDAAPEEKKRYQHAEATARQLNTVQKSNRYGWIATSVAQQNNNQTQNPGNQ